MNTMTRRPVDPGAMARNAKALAAYDAAVAAKGNSNADALARYDSGVKQAQGMQRKPVK